MFRAITEDLLISGFLFNLPKLNFQMEKTVKLYIQLSLTVALMLGELGVGFITNSVALIADAFHMLNDVISLVIAIYAVYVIN